MRTFSKLSRVVWTVRYLKARQIAGQVHHRVVRSFERYENANAETMEAYPGCAWPNGVRFLPPGAQNNRADAIRQGILEFLHSPMKGGFPPRWDCPEASRLWRYNLHYFEWLWALDYEDARTVALDWIRNHPLAKDAVGWESYPISLRLMNWCGVFWGRFRDQTETDPSFLGMLWRSICQQAGWLMRHLETHLLGNHYLENGAALALVGSCFFGARARRWFGKGYNVLQDQVAEQILPDGMHFELSPMYHCRVIYVLAMLVATGHDRLRDLAEDPLARMLKALDLLCHPDGAIALLNDSALGISNEPDGLRSYGRHLLKNGPDRIGAGTGCFALDCAGYYGWRGSDGSYVIADFARVGPDHIPGHGHADIFGFELSLGGYRVVTDSGVHDYESSATRHYCRSTAAHNTVEIDGCDQGELWGAFRMARRGYPRDVSWQPRETGFTLSGWHDGYRRLPGQPVPFRHMQWDSAGGLIVCDRIQARRPVRCVSRLHLHPMCQVDDSGQRVVRVSYPGGRFRVEADTDIQIKETPYFAGFYEVQPRPCLCLDGRGDCIELRYRIRMERVGERMSTTES